MVINSILPENVTARSIDSPLAYHDIGITWNRENTNPLIRDFSPGFRYYINCEKFYSKEEF